MKFQSQLKLIFLFVGINSINFYLFLLTRWRNNVTDLETLAIGFVVLLNTIDNKSFKVKDLNRKKYFKLSQGSDDIGVNAMSLSDITGIPRPTVVRKLKYLIKNNFLHINEKKLITMNITRYNFKKN